MLTVIVHVSILRHCELRKCKVQTSQNSLIVNLISFHLTLDHLMQCHAGCRALIPEDCNFGMLQPIFLPPAAVSTPRTEVPMEAIIGVHVRPPPSQRDFGCRKCPLYSARTVQLPPHVPRTAPRTALPGHPRRRRAVAAVMLLWICET